MTGSRRPTWLLFLVPPVVVGIAILARRYIAVPVTTAIWSIVGFFDSFGQGVIWTVLVFFFAVSVVGVYRGEGRPKGPGAPRSPHDTTGTRAAYWQRLVSQLAASRFSHQLLGAEVRQLALSILAHAEGRPPNEVEAGILDGRIDVPECVRRFLRHEVAWEQPRGFLARLFRSAGKSAPQRIDEGALEELVSYLERRLGAGVTRLPGEEG